MKKVIQSFNAMYYNEVHEITKWSGKKVRDIKSIGFISENDVEKYPSTHYVISPVSTSLLGQNECTLDPFLI